MLHAMARVTVTVSEAVLQTWRECAELQGVSLSGLIAEWMGELQPGLADVVKFGHAMKAADEKQRESLRKAVVEAEALVQPQLFEAWERFHEVVGGAGRRRPEEPPNY
jgi:hypothetical protein